MYAIKVIKDGVVIGYRADTEMFATVAEIDRASLFGTVRDACVQVLIDTQYLPAFDDFEIEEL